MNVQTTRCQALQTLGLSGLATLTSWLLRKAVNLSESSPASSGMSGIQSSSGYVTQPGISQLNGTSPD